MKCEIDYEFVEQNWKKVPLIAIAEKLNIDVLELISSSRKKGIIRDLQPIELNYIYENLNRIPITHLAKKFCISKSNLTRLVSKNKPNSREFNLEVAIIRTKWLIEEKLKAKVDDFLPEKITDRDFIEADLYNCLKLACQLKANDNIFKYFSAKAFLICHAYPNYYKPYQFPRSKNQGYFKGRNGKRHLIAAVKWVIEEKLSLRNIQEIHTNKYFLKKAELGFYGIKEKYILSHFNSYEEFQKYIVCSYKLKPKRKPSAKLALKAMNMQFTKCEAKNCKYTARVDIHHIIPLSEERTVNIDVHSEKNLIPLCPNHHRVAHTFNWQSYYQSDANLKEQLIIFLEKKGYDHSV